MIYNVIFLRSYISASFTVFVSVDYCRESILRLSVASGRIVIVSTEGAILVSIEELDSHSNLN